MFVDDWFDDMSRITNFKMSKKSLDDFGLAKTLSTSKKQKIPHTDTSLLDDRFIDNEIAKFKTHNEFLADVDDYDKKYMPSIDFSHTDPQLYQYKLKGKTMNDMLLDKVQGIDKMKDEIDGKEGQGDSGLMSLNKQKVIRQVKVGGGESKSSWDDDDDDESRGGIDEGVDRDEDAGIPVKKVQSSLNNHSSEEDANQEVQEMLIEINNDARETTPTNMKEVTVFSNDDKETIEKPIETIEKILTASANPTTLKKNLNTKVKDLLTNQAKLKTKLIASYNLLFNSPLNEEKSIETIYRELSSAYYHWNLKNQIKKQVGEISPLKGKKAAAENEDEIGEEDENKPRHIVKSKGKKATAEELTALQGGAGGGGKDKAKRGK